MTSFLSFPASLPLHLMESAESLLCACTQPILSWEQATPLQEVVIVWDKNGGDKLGKSTKKSDTDANVFRGEVEARDDDDDDDTCTTITMRTQSFTADADWEKLESLLDLDDDEEEDDDDNSMLSDIPDLTYSHQVHSTYESQSFSFFQSPALAQDEDDSNSLMECYHQEDAS